MFTGSVAGKRLWTVLWLKWLTEKDEQPDVTCRNGLQQPISLSATKTGKDRFKTKGKLYLCKQTQNKRFLNEQAQTTCLLGFKLNSFWRTVSCIGENTYNYLYFCPKIDPIDRLHDVTPALQFPCFPSSFNSHIAYNCRNHSSKIIFTSLYWQESFNKSSSE